MTDFETDTIKSVKDMLPNVLHKGMLQSTYKKLIEIIS